ncbi:MAG: sulfurtransferase TusA family protein [bacterium]
MSQTATNRIVLKFHGVKCPYNYVKTKLALEEMELGQIVEVIVDEGEPSRHVPKSITADGQTLLDTFKDESGLVHLVIQKTKEY